MSVDASAEQVTEQERDRLLRHMQRLTAVGIAISAERDIRRSLDMIVKEAMDLTNADAATLYLVTPDEQRLRFEIVLNRSLGTDLRGSKRNLRWDDVPLSHDGRPNLANVSAYAAIVREPVNIPDVYNVAAFDFSGTRHYDEENGYRCRSWIMKAVSRVSCNSSTHSPTGGASRYLSRSASSKSCARWPPWLP